jgi:hypothetical protein
VRACACGVLCACARVHVRSGDSDDGGCGWFDSRFSARQYAAVSYTAGSSVLYPLGNAVVWSVRIGSDPYAYAAFETGGALNFGTKPDVRAHTPQ